MAGFLKGLLDVLKLPEDDESFEEYEQTKEAPVKKASGSNQSVSRSSDTSRAERKPAYSEQRPSASQDNVKKAHTSSNYGTSTYIESHNNSKTLRMERPEGSKVVPLKTIRGFEVCCMKPHNLEDSQDICDVLLSGCIAIVNLEDNDLEISQRIMDFISGAVYSANGKLFQISDPIFLIAPDNVDVSGDYDDILAQTGFDVPLIK